MPQPVIIPYLGSNPNLHEECYISEGVSIVGDVTVGAESSVWFGSVVRGDVAAVRIGKRSNIQDGTIIHVSRFDGPTVIGDDVTVGHQALLHACTLQHACFVGMGAVVMDHATVETGAMLAAGSLLTEGKTVPPGEVWAGRPATFFRAISAKEAQYIHTSADNYVRLSREYLHSR